MLTFLTSNLVNANHVIFVAPLLAEDQYKYDASMAQAIARCRRYRQEKEVHIYHFAALRTIDVDILEQRHRLSDTLGSRKTSDNVNSSKKKKEKVRMVRNAGGEVSLIPRPWLADRAKCKKLRIDPAKLEKLSSLISFSEAFKEDDD